MNGPESSTTSVAQFRSLLEDIANRKRDAEWAARLQIFSANIWAAMADSSVPTDLVQAFISELLDPDVFKYARITISDLRSDTQSYSGLSRTQRVVMHATLELRQDISKKAAAPRQQLPPEEQAEEQLLMELDMRRFSELIFGNGNPDMVEQEKLGPLMAEWKKLVQTTDKS